MWNFVASWHRYICFYIQLISILLITYIIYTRFSMQNSARQTVSRMYMPFLNDLKILPQLSYRIFLHSQFHYADISTNTVRLIILCFILFARTDHTIISLMCIEENGSPRFSSAFYSGGSLSFTHSAWSAFTFALLIDQHQEGLSKYLIRDASIYVSPLCI